MKGRFLAVAAVSCSLVSGFAQAQGQITSELDASLRLGLGLNTEPDAELTFNDYNSRIRWRGTADAGEGLKAISYLEFGFDEDNGVSTTRHAWLGVEGDFGTVKGGKQYTAFYDAVSAAIDIAYIGSCYSEIGCDRQSSVVKFAAAETAEFQYMASTTLVANDLGNDFIDALDVGMKMLSGDMTIGAGISVSLGDEYYGNELVDGVREVIDYGTGFGLGASITMPVNEGTASVSLQYGNDNYSRGNDDSFVLTAAFQKDQMYGVVSAASGDDSPFYLTLGYEKPVIEKKAFAYFEVAAFDQDAPGVDLDLQARAVMVFNMDLLSMGQ